MYNNVLESRERDKVVRGGEGREEGLGAVCFELDPEGGEDEEELCVRKVWVGSEVVGGLGGGRTMENLGEARPDEACEHDTDANDENGRRDTPDDTKKSQPATPTDEESLAIVHLEPHQKD